MTLFAAGSGGPLDASTLGISLWVLVTFGLLFLLLYKTVWPKLLSALDEREDAIRKALEDADHNRAEAAKLLDEHKQVMEKAKEEARALLEEERVSGEKLRHDIVAKAKDEANQIVAKAKEEIDFERQKAVEALRREAVEMSLAAAGTVLGRAIDDSDHRRLAEEAVADLGKLKA